MNLLIVGSSSEIATELIDKLKKLKKIKIFTLSRKKNSLKNHYFFKEYNEKNFVNFKKKLKEIKFDKIIFFNGYQKFSVLSFINIQLMNKIFKINYVIPIQIWSFLYKNQMLKNNSSCIFVGSIAAELNEVGNAYYSLAKTLLNKSVNILNQEQKKKHNFYLISLGMVKNKMSKKMIDNFPGKFKNLNSFIDTKIMINIFKKIILSKKLHKPIIKIHGKYKI
jgi:short-subunit dehydrogenase